MNINLKELKKVIVIIEGEPKNKIMLQRLRDLGYTYPDGEQPDPNNVMYCAWGRDKDDRIVYEARYGVGLKDKSVAYCNYLAMMHHKKLGTPIMELDDFLAQTEKDLEVTIDE